MPPRETLHKASAISAASVTFSSAGPGLSAVQLDIDRIRARALGLTQKEVVGNIIPR
jgi:hypothetical protein